jgi:hypothetical protein
MRGRKRRRRSSKNLTESSSNPKTFSDRPTVLHKRRDSARRSDSILNTTLRTSSHMTTQTRRRPSAKRGSTLHPRTPHKRGMSATSNPGASVVPRRGRRPSIASTELLLPGSVVARSSRNSNALPLLAAADESSVASRAPFFSSGYSAVFGALAFLLTVHAIFELWTFGPTDETGMGGDQSVLRRTFSAVHACVETVLPVHLLSPVAQRVFW